LDNRVIGGILLMGKSPEELLELVVRTADERQAQDIVALDMEGISVMADYNVIAHGSNNRLIKAIANGVSETAAEEGVEIKNIEGKQSASWILIDLGAVIFHVFDEDEREHYNLEGLWTEAEEVDIADWIIEE